MMELGRLAVILLLHVVKIINSYTLEYKGFDDCGVGGWHCNANGSDYEVTFECSNFVTEVRLWAWTARVPSRTTILGVNNCQHVELHMDCTTGYRAYSMRLFRATNVKYLEILKPLKPHVFLHDNDQLAHAPPELEFSNVGILEWAPKTFERAGGRCRTKQQVLKKLTFKDVNVQSVPSESFSDVSLDSLTMLRVKGGLNARSLSLKASYVEIENSPILNTIPKGAIEFTADTVLISGNNIENIASGSIKIQAHSFEFLDNQVNNVEENAFEILARLVLFSKNNWKMIRSDAFSKVSPGERKTESTDFQIAEKFSYNFSNNVVVDYMENSLHPNYLAYQDVCSTIKVEGNSFKCNCSRPYEYSEIFREEKLPNCSENCPSVPPPNHHLFYQELISTETNYCQATPNCSILQTLTVLKRGNCKDGLHPEATCNTIHGNLSNIQEVITQKPTTNPPPSTPTSMPIKEIPEIATPSANTDDGNSANVVAVTVASVISVIVVIGIVGVWYLIYTRRRETTLKMSACYQQQLSVGADEDEESLIVSQSCGERL